MDITKMLFELQDVSYGDFHAKLMPGIPREKIIGVRIPNLRKLAKELFKNSEWEEFIKNLPHTYYEENNLHAFIVEQIKDFKTVLSETKRFLPYIDNWATCDSFRPKVFAKNKEKLYPEILKWLESSHTYTVRYGIGMLLTHFLDDDFEEELKRQAIEEYIKSLFSLGGPPICTIDYRYIYYTTRTCLCQGDMSIFILS